MMFDGLRSRCTICAAWAVSKASATSTREGRPGRHRRRIDSMPQRLAAHVLHGDERMSVLFAGLVNLADIGMVERRGSRLTKEAASRVFLLSDRG